MKGGLLKIIEDILFFKNYLQGKGPFDNVSDSVGVRDVIRFYRYRNGYFLTLLRLSEFMENFRFGWFPRFFLNFLFSSDISPGCRLGASYFPHPFSIVIGGSVSIKGPVVIFNDINIGKTYPGVNQKMPVIGRNVIISCGSRILGDISVGSNVVIGANAVLSKSIGDSKTFIRSDKFFDGTYFQR